MSKITTFKAKTEDNGEWRYSEGVVKGDNGEVFFPKVVEFSLGASLGNLADLSPTNPETLCQNTCKYDKYFKEIYEYDKLETLRGLYKVLWDSDKAMFIIRTIYPDHGVYNEEPLFSFNQEYLEIVGNIHD